MNLVLRHWYTVTYTIPHPCNFTETVVACWDGETDCNGAMHLRYLHPRPTDQGTALGAFVHPGWISAALHHGPARSDVPDSPGDPAAR